MLRKIRRHWAVRWIVWATIVALLVVQVRPAHLMAAPRFNTRINWNRGLKAGHTQFAPKGWTGDRGRKTEDSRELTAKEMRSIKGRGPYRNKYFSGVLPWQRQIRDVNLCNGNLFKSFTDIQVAP